MAYISTQEVANIRKALKEAFPDCKFGVSRAHGSSISITLKAAPFRFTDKDYSQINEYYPDNYTNADILRQMIDIAKSQDWFDESDSMTDYFHTAYYINIHQGAWDKPFVLLTKPCLIGAA